MGKDTPSASKKNSHEILNFLVLARISARLQRPTSDAVIEIVTGTHW